VSDLLTAPLEFINRLVGQASSGGAIPFFDPFYNIVIILWMAAIAAILVCPFWKKFRAFAVFLTWLAVFTTFVMRGSSPEGLKLDVLSAYLNMSLSVVLLVLFVILTLWLFGRLVRGKKLVPTPKVGQ
jgi:hypothetical protein